MHPYFHAQSSVRAFGGKVDDYVRLHTLLDSTKEHYAGPQHRLLLHNTWGVYLLESMVGDVFVRESDGKPMPLRLLLERHICEDVGRVPTLQEWLQAIPAYEISSSDDVYIHATHSASLYGGNWRDYRVPHQQMNRVAQVLPDSRSQRILHNAWGINLLEMMLGDTFMRASDGMYVSTRMMLEEHVRVDCGNTVPTLAECLSDIPLATWMYVPALASSRQFRAKLKGGIEWEETVQLPAITKPS